MKSRAWVTWCFAFLVFNCVITVAEVRSGSVMAYLNGGCAAWMAYLLWNNSQKAEKK